MTIIANATKTFFATIGLVCASIIAIFIRGAPPFRCCAPA